VGLTAVAALLGTGIAVGALLIIHAARADIGSGATPRPRRRLGNDLRRRALRASVLGAPVAVLTRWPVAALAAAALGWFSPDLLGQRAAREAAVARIGAIATWTEMLRDTIAAAHGLEAAIVATAPVAPAAIHAEILGLALAIEHEPLAAALARLADDLANPIADLVVAALTIAATSSARDLPDLLGALATSARDEAAMELRIEAARARMRTAVRVVTGCTVATAGGLVVLNPSYVGVYSSAIGQLALAVIAICWGGALAWLAQLSQFRTPERFLLATPAGRTSP
jgi:hypothetical protein